eukprot:CAMPEP_0172777840 /NCGR_PEP_ID=MMETSP1074-20121228/201603_1 /TAXON_ID=2916 /ORGANISM="Ceratium fusus, Strain PA161109" /LENGTH=228 /DNA_ID=CAMNT_0013614769 /DNA_START=983 /DNA_END=1670 /DNA_ORIENTATION=-
MASGVTAEYYYHRFFVVSEWCPMVKRTGAAIGHGQLLANLVLLPAKWNFCDVPLVYGNRNAGGPRIYMETNKYSAVFHESSFKLLGTGIPVPESAIFAGSTGTDCAPNVQCAVPPLSVKPVLKKELDVTSRFVIESPSDPGHLDNETGGDIQLLLQHGLKGTDCAPNVQCAVPPLSVKPVLKKELDVTSRFVIESPSDPGHLLLMSNRNTGTVQNTYEVEFALDPKKA